jgi:hypothetical protein
MKWLILAAWFPGAGDEALHPMRDWGMWVFSGLLVVVGTLQWLVLRNQAKIMREHASHLASLADAAKNNAKAASDNATAALLSALAILSSERPWIVISIEPHQTVLGNYVFKALNKGRTPAEFESGTFDWSFDSYPADLRTPPTYSGVFNAPNQTLVMPNEGFDIQPDGSNPVSMI